MKALIQTDYGDPAKVLELRDVPVASPGEGEVVVDIEAAVVHVADARTVLGLDGFRKKLPRTPGYEGVGRISAVARDVKGLAPGMRVFAPIGAGTYREQITVSAEDLMIAPEGDPVQLALLSLSPATAMLMLQDFAKLLPGDFVVQNAANSSVGRMVIQLANDMKVKVVNIVKSSGVIPELKELGAGVVLLDTPDLRDRVAAVTQSSPVKLAIDAVGGAATARLAACLDENATIVCYSSMSGEPCHMPADLLGGRGIRLCGINPARQLAKHKPEERRALYKKFGELLKAGRLRGRLGATYTLESAVDAIRHVLRDGDKRIGRVVIRVRALPVPIDIPVPPGEAEEGVPMPGLAAEPADAATAAAAATSATAGTPATAADTPAAAGAAPPETSKAGAA
ncbi:MAG: zinc-dependent alcohol dehydrogenase family protein [Gammaproteobacteria bacterium]